MGLWLTNTQDIVSVHALWPGTSNPSLPTTATFHGSRLFLGYAADILRGGWGLESAILILLPPFL